MIGLEITCPVCGKTGVRAAVGSDIFTAPPGHEVEDHDGVKWVVCYFDQTHGPQWWWP
jgi:hypothetical protein